MRRTGWIRGGRIAAAVVLAGLAAYLAYVGLDKANQLASVLSLLVAVAALVAPYLLPPSADREPESRAAQLITNATVGGHLIQVRDAKGVRLHGSVAAGPPPPASPAAGPVPESQEGQYINGVWVRGNLTQIDGADADFTIG